MSIASEITRLQWAKSNIKTAIEWKWVTVSAATKLDWFATLIDSIPTWSPAESIMSSYAPKVTETWFYWSSWLRWWAHILSQFIYWDYLFMSVWWSSHDRSYDYYETFYFVIKKWRDDFKQYRQSWWSTRDSYYTNWCWNTEVIWNKITLWVWYNSSYWSTAPAWYTTATFNFSTDNRESWSVSDDRSTNWSQNLVEFSTPWHSWYSDDTVTFKFKLRQS